MKKVFLNLFIILVVMSLLLLNYSNQFTISDDTYQLQENLKVFINRTSEITNNVEIKQSVEINNKKYVLFIMNDSMGFAVLTKGFNNKYKIYSAEYGGSGLFKGYIYKTNKAKYLIIYGRNDNMKINYVKVYLENKEYKINVPKEEYYLVYSKIPDEIKITFPDINNYKFYDTNDEKIINY